MECELRCSSKKDRLIKGFLFTVCDLMLSDNLRETNRLLTVNWEYLSQIVHFTSGMFRGI